MEGGARLTAEAQDLIARFHRFSDGLEREVEDRFTAAFASHEN